MPTVTIDNIPVYQAVIGSAGTGMVRISLVDDPAVQSNFQHFDSSHRPVLFRVEDEEKRLILGCVMRADFPIYRRDKEMGEYYIIYKAETIREMAQQYLAEGRQNDVNLMHAAGSDVEGVEMVQYFLKDTAKGIAPEGFADIADGSLFAEFHVLNDEVWEAVKEGTYQGFSLEGYFDLVPERDAEEVQDIVDRLAGKFAKLFKITNMGKVKKILARLLQEMATVTTDKGVLAWDGDDEIKVGDKVYLIDEDENRTEAPDGDYAQEDGTVIVVANGEVTEIREPAAPAEDPEPASFAEAETDNGTLQWEGQDDLKAGDEVFIADGEGNRNPAPDGEYRTPDGKVIVVADGKVTEIRDDSAEVSEEEKAVKARKETALAKIQKFSESYDEKVSKISDALAAEGLREFYVDEAADDYAVAVVFDDDWYGKAYRYSVSWNEDGTAAVSDPVEVKMIWVPVDFKSPFDSEPSATEQENEQLRAQVQELTAKVEKLSAEPAAKPAHEELKEAGKGVQLEGNANSRGSARIAYLMGLGND